MGGSTMEQLLRLKYVGADADRSEMEAYEVADAIRGFSDFTRMIGLALYGKEAEIQTKVRGFAAESLDIDLWYRILGPDTVPFIISVFGTPADFIRILKECFDLIKHLGGDPPKSVRHVEGHGVCVENNHGVINQFSDITVNIIRNEKTGRAARAFVAKPLEKSANQLEVIANDNVVASASKEDAKAFVPIDASDVLTEYVSEVHLIIQTVAFDGKTRWKFSDGRGTFTAQIDDEDFLARVESGEERFGRGDELVVRLRATQKRVNGKLHADYVIERVLDHVKYTAVQGQMI